MVGTSLLGVVGDWSMGLLQLAVEDDGVTECLGFFRVGGDGFINTTICPSVCPNFQLQPYADISYGIRFVKKGGMREKSNAL
jgi:hypothetical protein